MLKRASKSQTKTPIEIMNFAQSCDCFPNTMIAYRILLTVPVTVVSAERSFSKLKLINSYLRSIMSQERLNGLAMLLIEKQLFKKLKYKNLINIFVSQKAKRTIFK
jgi:hypothetical protein